MRFNDTESPPALARPEAGHAPALKTPLKRAGGAGRALRARYHFIYKYLVGGSATNEE